MKPTRWRFRALCGTALPILCGCYAAPYGYTTYPPPQYYAPPPQGFVAPPGGVIAPGTSYPTPQLGPPVSPGGSTWTPTSPPTIGPTPANPGPMPGNPNDSAPPTFRPDGARKPDSPVPNPLDDPGSRLPPSSPRSLDSPSSDRVPFNSEGSQKSFDSKGTQLDVPRSDGGTQSMASAEPFQPPFEGDSRRRDGLVAVGGRGGDDRQTADRANSYDYDREGYTYLRGLADYDPRDHSWHIIYTLNPDPKDLYGGTFQLVDNSRLTNLRSGDFVKVQGRVSASEFDSRGKPKYVSEVVERITFRGSESLGN